MYRRIFLDANVLIDLYDDRRPFMQESRQVVAHLLEQEEVELFTSCDIMTTLYYLYARQDRQRALDWIEEINGYCTIIEFANAEVAQSCRLMRDNPAFDDLEDTIQYVMARKIEADVILSNDANFASEGIEVITTAAYRQHINH
jgi:predicted nucleic acid-binding protein